MAQDRIIIRKLESFSTKTLKIYNVIP